MGKRERTRLITQIVFTALTNGYAAGFAQGSIYKGPLKRVCVPGLSCYSCPGAFASCPLGSLQNLLGDRRYRFPFFVAGLLLLFGVLLGRFVCGFLCPFGLVQDLLYKLRPKKAHKLPRADRYLKYLKYIMLAVLVIALPLASGIINGVPTPYFCKLVCPAGTLMAGIPLSLLNPDIGGATGWLFAWKAAVLLCILVAAVLLYRPFCRYLCPLGAIYGFLNPVALAKHRVESSLCTRCGACQKACPWNIKAFEKPNSMECIRCGRCISACPTGALRVNIAGHDIKERENADAKTDD